MPTYTYEGRDSSGDAKKGTISAASVDAARTQLKKMNINATSIAEKPAIQ